MSLVSIACGLAASDAWAASSPPLFDKPLQERHRPLPRDPLNPQFKPELSCYVYPGLMIKQTDMGEIGAARIGLIRLAPKAKAPPCVRKPAKGEIDLVEGHESAGNFRGIKGPFVLVDAPESIQGGLALSFFDFDGRKLFEDLLQGNGLQQVELLKTDPTQLRLRYRRLFPAECSLYTDPAGCWQSIRQATGLNEKSPPDCRADYESMAKAEAPERVQSVFKNPSVIDYDAELIVALKGPQQRAAPVSAAVRCWPAE
ncbi:hypothetical protein GCM10027046_08220 [Uliginosibacterium flavum]|uniref:Uncharacterized protein n=1 Tax=Uliginosibacterium flavum TaxID=1396831 RepID=A0ABV2TK45_9RHOO